MTVPGQKHSKTSQGILVIVGAAGLGALWKVLAAPSNDSGLLTLGVNVPSLARVVRNGAISISTCSSQVESCMGLKGLCWQREE